MIIFEYNGLTQKSGAARVSTDLNKEDKLQLYINLPKQHDPGCHLNRQVGRSYSSTSPSRSSTLRISSNTADTFPLGKRI